MKTDIAVIAFIVMFVVICLMQARHSTMREQQRLKARTKQQKRIDRSMGGD